MPAGAEFRINNTPDAQHDFGSVPAGSTAAAQNITLVNTGDVAFTETRLWIEQGNTDEGVGTASIAGTPLTGTPQTFGPLAPGASLSIVVGWTTATGIPGVAEDLAFVQFEADY